MPKVMFNVESNDFYNTLKKEVYGYFEKNNTSYTGNYQLYLKTFIFYGFFIYAYIHLVFFTPESPFISLVLCFLLGLDVSLVGFNVMHDACHGSYSKSKRVNTILGYSMNFLGSNSYIWKLKHNVMHHTYTNIDDADSDIIQTKLLRLAPTQEKMSVHRYQYIYCIFLYSISYIAWIFYNDFHKYFNQKVHKNEFKGFNTSEHVIFWVSKILYVILYLAIPIYMLGFAKALLGYFVLSVATGLALTLVFQLAHVVEITEFEDATHEDLSIPHEWAIHQVNTTANFAMKDRVLSWFLGGLNFQVEHHLFPKVSHVHYHKIQPIVQSVCERFNVQYRSYNTMSYALASHFKKMKQLGEMD